MTILFFGFLNPEEQRPQRRPSRWAILAAAALWLAVGIPAASAGLIPSGKDRAQGDALFQQAGTAFQGGDLAGALRLLEQADALKPDQADAWNLRGVVLLKQRAYDKAEAAFGRAVSIDTALWEAQFNLAEVSFQKKDWGRAQGRFDRLLAQTNRFKSADHWELVAYKSFLCALLAGGEAGARKELGRLPATGGTTPAFLYAQAALAFSRKDAPGAVRIVSGARTTYPAAMNELFTNSLETAGWQSPAPASAPAPGAPPVNVDPETAAAMLAAGITNPNNAPAPARRPAVVIDPRLVAAASDPLPSGPGRDVMPVNGPAGKNGSSRRAAKEKPAADLTASVVPEPAVTPPQSPLEHEGLLLGLD